MKMNKNQRTEFEKEQKFGNWKLKEYLAQGGNGEIWTTENLQDCQNVVIKILKIKKNYQRFKDEIEVVRENDDIKGLLNNN